MAFRDRFTIRRYDYLVDYEAADADLTDEDEQRGDLSSALAALDEDCWDNIDQRDTEVILYPADWDQDYRTGDVTYTTVVIECANPRHLERVMTLWRHRTRMRLLTCPRCGSKPPTVSPPEGHKLARCGHCGTAFDTMG